MVFEMLTADSKESLFYLIINTIFLDLKACNIVVKWDGVVLKLVDTYPEHYCPIMTKALSTCLLWYNCQ